MNMNKYRLTGDYFNGNVLMKGVADIEASSEHQARTFFKEWIYRKYSAILYSIEVHEPEATMLQFTDESYDEDQ